VGENEIAIRASAMAESFTVTTTSRPVAMIVAADSAGRLATIYQTLRRHIPEDSCLHRHITLHVGILVRTRELGIDCVVFGLLA
jgi:antitoxin (DNA-binding transcriptional repressor) of toxin-antitoxin stability system